MTENIEDAQVIETIAENTPATPDATTAFIIIKQNNNDWYATADLSTAITVDREATVDDIKHGCQDIVDSMNQNAIAYQVMALLKPIVEDSDDSVASSIKQALQERDIL